MIAEEGLCRAAKDISQGGIVGTAAMLAECSGVEITIDVDAVPRPEGVTLGRWLLSFPSFGYLLSVQPENVPAVLDIFTQRGIAAADIGTVSAGRRVVIANHASIETIWDFATEALIGCAVGAEA
jgi:selenophosphate synthetase-related protein